MITSPVADTGLAPFFFLLACSLAIVLAIVVVALEAMAIRFLRWGNFRVAIVDSLLANLASLVLGALLLGLIIIVATSRPPFPVDDLIVGLLGGFTARMYVDALLGSGPATLPWTIGNWALSVVIEGIVLFLLRRRPLIQVAKASSLMNLISYAFLHAASVLIYAALRL